MEKVYLSIGSNLGNREDYILEAVKKINRLEDVKQEKVSSVYETEPYGYKDQPNFYNIALELSCGLTPVQLLDKCKKIEEEIGRINRGRWKQREIDIDIIFFGNDIIDLPDLKIPHKDLYYRRFVLEPLNEIASDYRCPRTLRSINDLLKICNDKSNVKIIHKFAPGVS